MADRLAREVVVGLPTCRMKMTEKINSGEEAAAPLRPTEVTMQLAEIARHALVLAANFKSVRTVQFRLAWRGIAGRVLRDEHWNFKNQTRAHQIISTDEVPLGDLDKRWPHVVAELMGRLVRSFDPTLNLDARWVEHDAPSFRNPHLRD